MCIFFLSLAFNLVLKRNHDTMALLFFSWALYMFKHCSSLENEGGGAAK
jgi:hypothetical protein